MNFSQNGKKSMDCKIFVFEPVRLAPVCQIQISIKKVISILIYTVTVYIMIISKYTVAVYKGALWMITI